MEQFSIDEAFLDMSARFSDRRREEAAIRARAAAIQTEIRETLGFTVNVGISENKLLAKMASDFEKPDKIHTLWPEELSAKFYPLPIRSSSSRRPKRRKIAPLRHSHDRRGR